MSIAIDKRLKQENTFYHFSTKDTVFDLITARTPISAQSSNSIIFRLQPVYFMSISYKGICCGYSFDIKAYVVGTHLTH